MYYKDVNIVRRIGLWGLLIVVGLIYAYSNPAPAGHFDYQLRIAEAMLNGHLGIVNPPSWLNEMTPSPRNDGFWYSVFPLGGVLSFLPVALVKKILPSDWYTNASTRWIVFVIAAGIAYFLFRLSARSGASLPRRLTLTAAILFGTWLWPNLVYGGAWHLSVCLAVLGQCGAICFALAPRPRPLLAGLFFALGFGNRTEVLLTAPVLLYLLIWRCETKPANRREMLFSAVSFCVFPFFLGVSTLAYNYARYGSVTDFGYERIPGLLKESWYRDGFFSLLAIPLNLHSMLLEAAWRVQNTFPFFVPNPMGGSIFASSPFLFLLFQKGECNRGILIASWIAILGMTLALFLHGNQGGWQFSYRYALILLPYFFLILLENSPPRVRPMEIILLILSVALNAFAVYQFYWTDFVHV